MRLGLLAPVACGGQRRVLHPLVRRAAPHCQQAIVAKGGLHTTHRLQAGVGPGSAGSSEECALSTVVAGQLLKTEDRFAKQRFARPHHGQALPGKQAGSPCTSGGPSKSSCQHRMERTVREKRQQHIRSVRHPTLAGHQQQRQRQQPRLTERPWAAGQPRGWCAAPRSWARCLWGSACRRSPEPASGRRSPQTPAAGGEGRGGEVAAERCGLHTRLPLVCFPTQQLSSHRHLAHAPITQLCHHPRTRRWKCSSSSVTISAAAAALPANEAAKRLGLPAARYQRYNPSSTRLSGRPMMRNSALQGGKVALG